MKKLLILLAFIPCLLVGQQTFINASGKYSLLLYGGNSFVDLDSYGFTPYLDSLANIDYLYAPHTNDYFHITPYNVTNGSTVNDSSIVHPSVIDFYSKTGRVWNGYRYWMAYTPLPSWPSDSMENISMAVSNNGTDWIDPPGMRNPIEYHPPVGVSHDPDLYFENNTLYVIYPTWVSDPTNRYVLKCFGSTNGSTWTGGEIYNIGTNSAKLTSPSWGEKKDNKYYIYCVNALTVASSFIYRLESSSITSGWAIKDTVTLDSTGILKKDFASIFYPSHIDYEKIDNKDLLILYMRGKDNDITKQELTNIWLASGTNQKAFQFQKYPLFKHYYDTQVNNDIGNRWGTEFYRSCVTVSHDSLILYYSSYWGLYLDYPLHVGKTRLLYNDVKEINIVKPTNTVSVYRNLQLDTADAFTNNYTFSDDCNRVNSTNINPSSCGENYTIGSGTFSISSNYIIRTNAGTAYFYQEANNNDFECATTVKYGQTNFTSDGQFDIYLRANATSYTVRLRSGFDRTLALTYNTTVLERLYNPMVLNDINVIKWRWNGFNVKVWINGVLYFDHTMTTTDTGSQSNLDNLILGKRIYYLWTGTTSNTFEIKNITIKNL